MVAVAGGFSLVWRGRRQEWVIVDDFKNPEVRDRIQRLRRVDVTQYISSPERAEILTRWPECKAFIEGLSLIEEKDVNYWKREAQKTPLRESMTRHLGIDPTAKELREITYIQTVMWAAIDTMTVRKGDRMPRRVRTEEAEEGSTFS